MSFGTAICCMDGRVQLPVIEYLKERFGVIYIDNITDAGPVGFLARQPAINPAESIFRLVEKSIQLHASTGVAIVAHHDCAGNPLPDEEQKRQLEACLVLLSERYPQTEVIALWIDKNMRIHEFPGGSGKIDS